MHGLTRVRGMTQDDSHSYVTPEQAPDEIKHLLDFVLGLLKDFGLDDFYLELSTRDDSKPDKFVGSDEEWAVATAGARGRRRPRPGSSWCPTPAARRSTARRSRCRPATRSAAPGRCRPSSTTSTSRKGFELEYQAADGTRQQPVMIHSAKFGSIERFIGVLVEHYAGAFPPWLAPGAGAGDPDRRAARRLPATRWPRGCGRAGIRVEVDDSDDRMQKKIRNAQLQKVPFMLIAGDNDVEAGAVSFRYRDGDQDNGVPVDDADRPGRRGRRRAGSQV